MRPDFQKMPFLFARQRDTRIFTELKPNKPNSPFRLTYFVKLARCHDMRHYDSRWMDCPHLGESQSDADLALVPDVDVTEEIWAFDSDDATRNYTDALAKMKELWSNLEVVQAATALPLR
jgi:uncharacterized protein YfaT (DUF1175 family)